MSEEKSYYSLLHEIIPALLLVAFGFNILFIRAMTGAFRGVGPLIAFMFFLLLIYFIIPVYIIRRHRKNILEIVTRRFYKIPFQYERCIVNLAKIALYRVERKKYFLMEKITIYIEYKNGEKFDLISFWEFGLCALGKFYENLELDLGNLLQEHAEMI